VGPLIRVVNKKTYGDGDGVYVGRPSPLGNPFTHLQGSKCAEFKVATRDEAVEKYQGWLQNALKRDKNVRMCFDLLVATYREFGELTLICWCAPLRCHAEIIRDMILEEVGEKSDS